MDKRFKPWVYGLIGIGGYVVFDIIPSIILVLTFSYSSGVNNSLFSRGVLLTWLIGCVGAFLGGLLGGRIRNNKWAIVAALLFGWLGSYLFTYLIYIVLNIFFGLH